jgi:lysophospholipase L1-like esterase
MSVLRGLFLRAIRAIRVLLGALLRAVVNAVRGRGRASVVFLASAMACGNTRCGSDSSAGPGANNPEAGADGAADSSGPPADASGADADAGSPRAEGGSDAAGSDAPTGNDATTDAAGDAAADAQPAYNPCPPSGTACRIMPLGDSITFGHESSTGGGYRVPLFQSALSANRNITFVGSQISGPAMVGGTPFPQNNEGHSGYTIDTGGGRQGILPLAPGAINTYKPHIVTLMIGTNDVDIQLDLANAPTRLATLIDAILGADSNLLLVVAQITPTQTDSENVRVTAYNAAIPAIVSARAKQGKHILLVDMYGALTANANYKTAYLANNLHPNDAGFVVMAGVWYAAIGSLFR